MMQVAKNRDLKQAKIFPSLSSSFFQLQYLQTRIDPALIMIVPGARAFQLGLLRNLSSEALQIQPCGIDLTLKRVLRVRTAGTVDYDNSQRVAAQAEELEFPLVDFNASVKETPDGQNGKMVHDSGYREPLRMS